MNVVQGWSLLIVTSVAKIFLDGVVECQWSHASAPTICVCITICQTDISVLAPLTTNLGTLAFLRLCAGASSTVVTIYYQNKAISA